MSFGNPMTSLHLLAGDASQAFNPLDLGEGALWFWTLVVFAILFLILSTKVWKPLMVTVAARENRIKDDLAKAKAVRDEAERALAEHSRKLDASAQEAKALLDEARQRAETLVTELRVQAQEDIQGERDKARREIQAERTKALQDIKEQVVELSLAVNERLAVSSAAPEDHRRQAELLLKQLKAVVR